MLTSTQRLYRFRHVLYRRGYHQIAGIDEAGRGPLAGPVVAAAVILPLGLPSLDIPDSRRVSGIRRAKLYEEIHRMAVAIGVGVVGPQQIDKMNIHNATLEAMCQAVLALDPMADFCLVDGKFIITQLPLPQRAVVSGDARVDCVAAASIIAKVTRDRLLVEMDHRYPHYGFAAHKGYPTAQHLQALETYGPCPIHRYSFAPVRLAGQCSLDLEGDDSSRANRTG